MSVRKSVKVYVTEEEKKRIENLSLIRGVSMSKLMLAITLDDYQREISGMKPINIAGRLSKDDVDRFVECKNKFNLNSSQMLHMIINQFHDKYVDGYEK